jgi:FkbM family methyltransferase
MACEMNRVKELVHGLKGKWDFLSAQQAFRLAPIQTTLRLASWRTRCLLRTAATVHLRRSGVRMVLPPNWRGVGKLIYAFRDYYEPELLYLEKVLSPGKVFVDAGANFGIYTLLASKIVGEAGRVISFEPSPRVFPVLRRNIALNGFKNVSALQVALTDKKGRAPLYYHAAVGCDSLAKDASFENDAHAEQIDTESLDNVIRQTSVGRVDVIKMDVQGAEELALRGASEIVASMRPVVIFEVFPEGAASLGLSPTGTWSFLESHDYEFFIIDGLGTVSRLKSPPPAIANVLAIHRLHE